MGIFNKSFSKKKETPAREMLMTSVMACEIVLDKNELSKGAVFEVMIFNSLYILRNVRIIRPNLYPQFEKDFFREMYLFAEQEGILNQIPEDFEDFMNNRFQLYHYQMKSIYDDHEGVFLPTKMAYNFYEKPLTINSGDSIDLPKMMLLKIKTNNLMDTIQKLVNMVIKENNL